MELSIKLESPGKADLLYGPMDRNLKMIREALGVQVFAREGLVKITGSAKGVSRAAAVLEALQRRMRQNRPIDVEDLSTAISTAAREESSQASDILDVYVSGQLIQPKTPGQRCYIDAMRSHDLVFCSGPAGTGKTYLAVAVAVHMLKHHLAKRLILVRPAVEAGEKLGFLPGDMREKVDPYLRPLYDALNDMIEFDRLQQFLERSIIEVAPLAFMRGRTMNHSFIILDEAQNATIGQMKMFLTRLGASSKAVITGDVTQTDLPPAELSGLSHAWNLLRGIAGIEFVELTGRDIVRHRLVQDIVDAYQKDPGAKR